MSRKSGHMFTSFTTENYKWCGSHSRKSFNVVDDEKLLFKTFTFYDAAKAQGRLFICDIQPAWKLPFLKLLGVRIHK